MYLGPKYNSWGPGGAPPGGGLQLCSAGTGNEPTNKQTNKLGWLQYLVTEGGVIM